SPVSRESPLRARRRGGHRDEFHPGASPARGEPKGRMRPQKRYRDLWINRDLASIDQAIEKYTSAHGRAPQRVEELVSAGLLASQPRDPQGGAYTIES